MIDKIAHVGLTVSNLEKSIEFYKDILGLDFKGKLTMEGSSTDILFNLNNCKVEVAYLNGSDSINCPPIELIEFKNVPYNKNNISLNTIGISEVCFYVDNIDITFNNLKNKGVEFLSEPQYFDFTKCNFGKSKAVYFKDPDGIILELLQPIS